MIIMILMLSEQAILDLIGILSAPMILIFLLLLFLAFFSKKKQ